ncbi:MAG: hypothetical protein MZW92_01205 [Comamonadaceae bacterium]|nr:hypothetical protein [Comamonadaceae bacterium]
MLALLAAGFAGAGQPDARFAEAQLYADDIVYAEPAPYQRIVVTRWQRRTCGCSSTATCSSARADEYRYHEALVHPGAGRAWRRAARAGAGRRRRPGAARDPQAPRRGVGHAGRPGPGDDAAVLHARPCCAS